MLIKLDIKTLRRHKNRYLSAKSMKVFMVVKRIFNKLYNVSESIYVRCILILKTISKKSKEELIENLIILKTALSKETKETKEMLEIYYRFTRGTAKQNEMEKANNQFRDLLKTMGLGVFAVLPLAPITIPFIVKIARKLGVEILPSSFVKKENSTK